MKLSVILPCFNGASTIAVQLDALTRQHWDEGWEVIVVNNGSTDNSMQIVQAYQDRLPDLHIVDAYQPGTQRLGVPHSYNTGIKSATGDAFVFCEADDEVGDGWLAAMGRALKDHNFVVAKLDHRKLNAPWLHPPYGNGYQADGLYRMTAYPYFYSASACGFGFTRMLYERLGPLSIEFPIVHDGEYCWRAQLAGYKIYFASDALIYYREKSELKARYRQGKSWGLDTTRMHRHYGSPLGRYALLKQLSTIPRSLPSGVMALLSFVIGSTEGKRLLAEWVWNLGWSTGRLLAIAQEHPVIHGVAAPSEQELAMAVANQRGPLPS